MRKALLTINLRVNKVFGLSVSRSVGRSVDRSLVRVPKRGHGFDL